jgi:hypothetical protein
MTPQGLRGERQNAPPASAIDVYSMLRPADIDGSQRVPVKPPQERQQPDVEQAVREIAPEARLERAEQI